MELNSDTSVRGSQETEAEARFKILLETIPSGIVMTDAQGRIILCNREVEKIFGYESHELNGMTIEKLVPMGARSAHPKLRAGYVNHPAKRPMGAGRDLKGVRKDGVEIPVEIGLNHLKIGNDIFVVASVVDITSRKKTEDQLRHVIDEIREKNAEMEQFVYSVSHDLKSPLVTSMSFLGFIREDIDRHNFDDVMDSLGRLERALKKMQELIDDLLQLSRVGRVEVKFEEIELKSVFRGVLEFVAEALEKKGARLIIPDDLPRIRGDRKRVSQVFENLIHNAVKYGLTDKHPEIRVLWRDMGEEIWICVKDNGPGIERQYQKKIFGLFQRLQSDQEGTGVGLTIVSRAMQLHRGRVWVESEPGQGSEFWVAFPKCLPSPIEIGGD
jgi:PAS domain S-box-containing protein